MARGTNPPKRGKVFSRKASNIAGYAKRKSLKGKALADASDVYEYQAEKVRRGKVKLDLEKDEMQGIAGDGSDDEGSVSGRVRPRLVGDDDEDDRIGSDEDEEIEEIERVGSSHHHRAFVSRPRVVLMSWSDNASSASG